MLSLFLGFLLSACRSTGATSEPTPTAFPQETPSLRITTTAPIPISLDYLAANPDFYVGATLHLTGQFRRLPVLACEGESYPSPATWGLEADGSLANASGMDAQLRSLLDEEQLITVEGRWLKYEGPVGCETNLQDQTIWYLSGDRVLDPHPLVRSLVTPIGEAPLPTATAELPMATIEQGEQTTMTAPAPPATTATAVPSLTPVSAATSPIITATANITPVPSATEVGNLATPTFSANLTQTVQPNGSPSPTPGGSATVTVTPGASATPSGALVDKGNLDPEDLTISTLGAGTIDRWQLNLSAGDAITITVAPASTADIVFSVLDSGGVSLVSEQNLAAAGEVETVTNLNITDPGIHDLRIRTEQGTQTDYALMIMDADSYSFIFRGTLPENSTRSDALAADNDHFWFFTAQGGESISFSITPESGKDPYIELYDPGGARMRTIDDSGESEVESVDNFTLPDSGMYGIRVAEFDFLPMSYQIVLTKP